MFRRKTVFVIGAGASCDLGLPTGQALVAQIASLLDIKFKDGIGQSSGSRLIYDAYRVAAHQGGGTQHVEGYRVAGREITNARYTISSIDTFLDNRRESQKIGFCGKLAIAEAILTAEKKSKLHFDINSASPLQGPAIEGVWYQKFVQQLLLGVPKESVGAVFSNIVFIIFNYDRCLEHFLKLALEAHYGLVEQEAAELVKSATFIHPYGTLGCLRWQDQSGIDFGETVSSSLLLKMAGGLHTFTEQELDVSLTDSIASQISRADTIVFLGFGFHDQNIRLLKSNERSKVQRVFATAKGISSADREVVEFEIRSALGASSNLRIELREDLECTSLFDEYQRQLCSA
jgi:hypothetical protein